MASGESVSNIVEAPVVSHPRLDAIGPVQLEEMIRSETRSGRDVFVSVEVAMDHLRISIHPKAPPEKDMETFLSEKAMEAFQAVGMEPRRADETDAVAYAAIPDFRAWLDQAQRVEILSGFLGGPMTLAIHEWNWLIRLPVCEVPAGPTATAYTAQGPVLLLFKEPVDAGQAIKHAGLAFSAVNHQPSLYGLEPTPFPASTQL